MNSPTFSLVLENWTPMRFVSPVNVCPAASANGAPLELISAMASASSFALSPDCVTSMPHFLSIRVLPSMTLVNIMAARSGDEPMMAAKLFTALP